MTTVIIYKPAKTATQSGRFKTRKWLMEFSRKNSMYTEPLMYWTSNCDPQPHAIMHFETLQQALNFAIARRWFYLLKLPHPPAVKPKSYATNFIKRL